MTAALALAFALVSPQAKPDFPDLVARFNQDERLLQRTYGIPLSATRYARMKRFYEETLKTLAPIPFDKLDREDQVDLILLEDDARRSLQTLEIEASYDRSAMPLMPFVSGIVELEEARARMETPDAKATAGKVDAVTKAIEAATAELAGKLASRKLVVTNGVDPAPTGTELAVTRSTANRVVRTLGDFQRRMGQWFGYYDGYDPAFSWWVAAPYKSMMAALDRHADFVRDRLVGIRADDRTTIIGFPIGREALLTELRAERIAYTPEELIALAEKEYAWCENEMKKASRALGCGDDWKKALEKVKNTYVEPGQQPELIRKLAREAEDFVEKKNLVSVDPLAKEGWRMRMMSPEAQLVNPFFTGGEEITVSYPTNGMSHEQKLMSLRGNNPHFSHATVQHELIPGHWLQQYMNARYRPYRGAFSTPFWFEGNSLYWELLLWDEGFHASPEDKVGALFWRMHRCARIIFSLSFHLGKMTPEQCVNLLVEKVGHERENALGEVRRSFAGNYSPLYQAAYMLGGLQQRALGKELVDGKKMTRKQYNDALLKEGPIPIDLIRAILTKEPIKRDATPSWRFGDRL